MEKIISHLHGPVGLALKFLGVFLDPNLFSESENECKCVANSNRRLKP